VLYTLLRECERGRERERECGGGGAGEREREREREREERERERESFAKQVSELNKDAQASTVDECFGHSPTSTVLSQALE